MGEGIQQNNTANPFGIGTKPPNPLFDEFLQKILPQSIDESAEIVKDTYVKPTGFSFLNQWVHKFPGFSIFKLVPPQFRTNLTDMMLNIEDEIRWLKELSVDTIDERTAERMKFLLVGLEAMVDDVGNMFLKDGSLSLQAMSRIQNELYRQADLRDKKKNAKGEEEKNEVTVMRINLNMSAANKVDATENLGTAFKEAAWQFFVGEYSKRQVSINPEGTSFTVINPPRYQRTCTIDRFYNGVMKILHDPDMKKKYGYTNDMLERFKPSAKAALMSLDVTPLKLGVNLERLRNKEISPEDFHAVNKSLLVRISGFMRELAAVSELIEKEPELFNLDPGLNFIDADVVLDNLKLDRSLLLNIAMLQALPDAGAKIAFGNDIEHTPTNTIIKAILIGKNFVPPAVNINERLKSVIDVMMLGLHTYVIEPIYRAFAAPAHKLGQGIHSARKGDPGGYYQQFYSPVRELLNAIQNGADKEELIPIIARVKENIPKFEQFIYQIAAYIRLERRNPLLVEKEYEFKTYYGESVNEQFLLEQLALMNAITPEDKFGLAVVEIDSMKASLEYHPTDATDAKFWSLIETAFKVAGDMGIDPPIVTKLSGDLFGVIFRIVDKNGKFIEPKVFISNLQKAVDYDRRYEKFPDQVKVVLPGKTSVHKKGKKTNWIVQKKRGSVDDTIISTQLLEGYEEIKLGDKKRWILQVKEKGNPNSPDYIVAATEKLTGYEAINNVEEYKKIFSQKGNGLNGGEIVFRWRPHKPIGSKLKDASSLIVLPPGVKMPGYEPHETNVGLSIVGTVLPYPDSMESAKDLFDIFDTLGSFNAQRKTETEPFKRVLEFVPVVDLLGGSGGKTQTKLLQTDLFGNDTVITDKAEKLELPDDVKDAVEKVKGVELKTERVEKKL